MAAAIAPRSAAATGPAPAASRAKAACWAAADALAAAAAAAGGCAATGGEAAAAAAVAAAAARPGAIPSPRSSLWPGSRLPAAEPPPGPRCQCSHRLHSASGDPSSTSLCPSRRPWWRWGAPATVATNQADSTAPGAALPAAAPAGAAPRAAGGRRAAGAAGTASAGGSTARGGEGAGRCAAAGQLRNAAGPAGRLKPAKPLPPAGRLKRPAGAARLPSAPVSAPQCKAPALDQMFSLAMHVQRFLFYVSPPCSLWATCRNRLPRLVCLIPQIRVTSAAC